MGGSKHYIPWRRRCCVYAPTGKPLLWSISSSRALSISLALEGRVKLWSFARMNGYSVRWVREALQ